MRYWYSILLIHAANHTMHIHALSDARIIANVTTKKEHFAFCLNKLSPGPAVVALAVTFFCTDAVECQTTQNR